LPAVIALKTGNGEYEVSVALLMPSAVPSQAQQVTEALEKSVTIRG